MSKDGDRQPTGEDRNLRRRVLAGRRLYRPAPDRPGNSSRLPLDQPKQAIDPLTGLANRDGFLAHLNRVLHRARDVGSPALLLVDLDQFKTVNDGLGHPLGDVVLQLVAQRLRTQLRCADFVARLDGDEFAVLLASGEAAEAVAARICEVLGRTFLPRNQIVNLSASVGIALAQPPATEAEDLLRQAGLALRQAKSAGRGGYCQFDTALTQRAQGRVDMEHGLRQALMLHQFEIHYQPQLNLAAWRPVGLEALLRWNHPARGLVGPTEFIPVAEKLGLIARLGEWVLRRACVDAMQWPDDLVVAVNVSSLQFEDGERFVQTVAAALASSRLPSRRLELEITESTLIRDPGSVLQIMNGLHALGVRLALDDFGTGYSSLGQLRRFPFDRLKIDQSFVEDLPGAADSRAMVAAIVTLGWSLGMSTLAEGIEKPEQAAMALAAGCTDMQGFLASPPVPVDQVTDLLARLQAAGTAAAQ
jgi:diguanylate cyclase (GGDEF)-like protein